MKNEKTERITVSAVMLACATVLCVICEYIPFLNLPFGGTITLASMLPVIIVAYMFGLRWGLLTAFCYSLIQMFLSLLHGSGGTVMALFMPQSDSYMGYRAVFILLFDYICAYTALGLGGLFSRKKSKTGALVLGAFVALAVSYLFHVLSGAVFYGAWAEWFFTDTVAAELSVSRFVMERFSGFGLALMYSFAYNGCYMIPEIIITTSLAAIVSRLPQIKKRR